ncbi:protein kinase [Leptothoe sp. EHU-05/26/07-4]
MAEASPPAWLGKCLNNRYEIRKELGKAVGRRTLLADDTQAQCPVVIKVITFGNDFEWANLRLFEREGEVLKSLNHAGIPGYLDYFEIDLPSAKGYALVQSYVHGQSLQEHLQTGRSFSEADVIDIAQRLLTILQYLHSQMPPIIHRDLKPSNILLSDRTGHSQGQLYLVDFGSVQVPFLNPSGTLTIVGTYGYMPPEQFGGRATPASDLYSLGATLIFLMTGCHPADLPQNNMRIQFESKAKHISSPIRQWLRWLIHPDVSQRPASATEALTGLQTVLEKGTLSALSERPFDQNRILVNQRDSTVDTVIRPYGFRRKQVGSWLDLLILGVIFSISSYVVRMAVGIVISLIGDFSGIYILFWFASSSVVSAIAGFIGMVLLPTPSRNRLLSQLHICLSDDNLIIYRETILLMRLRKVLFQTQREDILHLRLETTKNILEIHTNHRSYNLKCKTLGLTTRESQWLAQELSNNLGVSLIST